MERILSFLSKPTPVWVIAITLFLASWLNIVVYDKAWPASVLQILALTMLAVHCSVLYGKFMQQKHEAEKQKEKRNKMMKIRGADGV